MWPPLGKSDLSARTVMTFRNCLRHVSRQSLSTACVQQALYSTFAASDSLAPAAIAGAVSAALFAASRAGRIPDALKPLMRNLLGWTATLLFMFQPLAQLVSLLQAPAALSATPLCLLSCGLISHCTRVTESLHHIRQVSSGNNFRKPSCKWQLHHSLALSTC